LGQSAAGAANPGETQYDARLFNQDKGMSSGFGADDDYSTYDKQLFAGSSMNQIHKAARSEDDGANQDMEKMVDQLQTGKFKPDQGFQGADASKEKGAAGRGGRPVAFEKDEKDPFGLDDFMASTKKR
jgi:SNW domain-containing protein 1